LVLQLLLCQQEEQDMCRLIGLPHLGAKMLLCNAAQVPMPSLVLHHILILQQLVLQCKIMQSSGGNRCVKAMVEWCVLCCGWSHVRHYDDARGPSSILFDHARVKVTIVLCILCFSGLDTHDE
jgi:hypothetical protein